MAMDWLSDNIIGSIPKLEELTEHAQPALSSRACRQRKDQETNENHGDSR